MSPVTGVIHQSPQFVDSQDYHLRGDTSAAFNAGDPAVLTAPTPLGVLDVDGDDRVIGAALDIGADELSTPRPSPTPTQGGPTLAAQPPGDSLGGIALVLAAMLLLVTQLRRLKPHA